MVDFIMFNISSYIDLNSKTLICILLTMFLTACGAGGGDSEPVLSEATNAEQETVPEEVEESVAPVVISSQPQSMDVTEGETATFTVTATGGGQLIMQWRKNEINLEGETGSSLTISNTGIDAAGQYSVVITNEAGSVSSLTALLTVQADSGAPAEEEPIEEPIEEPVEEPVVASVQLSWDIPVLRDDGSDLELYEINGYIIKYGIDQNNLDLQLSVDGASNDHVTIDELNAGTYYFSIATVDSDGLQGSYSAQLEQIVL